MEGIRNLKLSGHVGFDSLPDQLVNKSVQNGFVFNILCIGNYYVLMFRQFYKDLYKYVFSVIHLIFRGNGTWEIYFDGLTV